MLGEGD